MADELGAVRRTPRPTGDRQTPETPPQESAGTTQTGGSVSEDAGNATGDLRAKFLDTFLRVTRDTADGAVMAERFIAEGWRPPREDPPPLAVHFAGPPVRAEGRRRQLCMWCGHVISDIPSRKGEDAPHWPQGALVQIEDGITTEVPYDGGELPPGCCALPDDEPEPEQAPEVHRTWAPGMDPFGVHVEQGSAADHATRRCQCFPDPIDLGAAPPAPVCTCTENLCDYDDHDNPPTGDECVPCGQRPEGTPCCALDGPDEAQETRAADWPAEETDHG